MSRPSRHRPTSGGFTLLELIIVIALVALVVGSAMRGFKSLASSDLRTASSKMAGGIRYLFDRASATGRIHRLVIDFQEQKYWAEVSDDRFMLAREPETAESREREAVTIALENEEKKKKEEEKAEGSAGGGYNLSAYKPEEFRPKRAQFSAFKEMAIKPVTLKGTKVSDVFTPRLAEPQSTGKGYIYFFPLGQTEPALVHLSDKDGQKFYSLIVHPLTGRVQIQSEFVEPQLQQQYDDEGKVIER